MVNGTVGLYADHHAAKMATSRADAGVWLGIVIKRGGKTLKKGIENTTADATLGDFILNTSNDILHRVSLESVTLWGHTQDPELPTPMSMSPMSVKSDSPIGALVGPFQIRFVEVLLPAQQAALSTCSTTRNASSVLMQGRGFTHLPKKW